MVSKGAHARCKEIRNSGYGRRTPLRARRRHGVSVFPYRHCAGLCPVDQHMAGSGAEAYHPVTNAWTTLPPVPVTNAYVSFVEAVNGLVYVGTNGQPVCLVYNPATNVWSAKTRIPFASRTMGYSPFTASIGGRLNVV